MGLANSDKTDRGICELICVINSCHAPKWSLAIWQIAVECID